MSAHGSAGAVTLPPTRLSDAVTNDCRAVVRLVPLENAMHRINLEEVRAVPFLGTRKRDRLRKRQHVDDRRASRRHRVGVCDAIPKVICN